MFSNQYMACLSHISWLKINFFSCNSIRNISIPTKIYTLPHEFSGWHKVPKFTSHELSIPNSPDPIYFGNLINICIPGFTKSPITEAEFNILRYSIMKHPGYFITPDFIFKVNFLFKYIKRHKVESQISKEAPNGILDFSRKDYFIIDNGIAIQHLYAANYFHIILEIFPTFFFLKKKFVENSIFLYRNDGIVGFNAIVFQKVLAFFGYNVPKSQMWDISDKTVMAKNLLIVTPRNICQLDTDTLLYMKEFILKKYYDSIAKSENNPQIKLNKEEEIDLNFVMNKYVPFRFAFFKHKRRKIVNYDELVQSIENKYKKVKFETPPIKIKDPMLEQVIFFHETILAIGVHSGSFANIFWMMPKGIIIEFSFKHCYSAVYRLSEIVGLHFYSMMFPRSRKDGVFFADINLVMAAFDCAIKELYRVFHVDYT